MQALPPRAALAAETRRVWRAEIASSTALANSTLEPHEVDALLDEGLARGDHPFTDYILVRAYADAARWVAEQRTIARGDPRPLITLDELRQLNARASTERGGAWRLGNRAARERIVAPAPWLVPREAAATIDRYGRGPGTLPAALWIARFLGRLNRIRPFEHANGRTSRLASNLMLRRMDYPPIVFERRERLRYPAALAEAEASDAQPLADLIARTLVRTCDGLRAAGDAASDPLKPVRALAGDEYSALAKAAQRGRLRTVMRGARYFTTRGWIAEYRARR
ncbi:MAG: Fic family protein [Candidatus Velthaea sp.]